MTRREVKRKFKKLGLTYYEAGKKLGVTSGTFSNWINGKMPSEPLDRKAAELLGVSVEEMPKVRRTMKRAA